MFLQMLIFFKKNVKIKREENKEVVSKKKGLANQRLVALKVEKFE